MLRSELIQAVDDVLHALSAAKVVEALRRQGADLSVELVLQSYHILSERISRSSPAAVQVIKILGLDPLLQSDWWTKILAIKNEEADRGRISMARNINFVIEKLPQVVELLKHEALQQPRAQGEQLTLLVPERKQERSKPERIVSAIASVVLIYGALCRIEGIDENTLTLSSCDSGSDKSFDFTGVPQIIEQVKLVIFGIVDRVIFYRELKYGERVKRVSESLPVLAQIADLAEAKKISAEQAELLRRDLILGATKFLETGATITELRDPTRYEPSLLLKPTPTLLLEGPDRAVQDSSARTRTRARRRNPHTQKEARAVESESSADATSDESSLSDAEQRQLRELLRRSRSLPKDGNTE